MQPLKIKAQMQPGTRRADGSVTIKVVTAEEISTEQFANIDGYRQQLGTLIFVPNGVKFDDLPKDSFGGNGKETPSQALRVELLLLHRRRGGKDEDFPEFYAERIGSLIEKIKSLE